MESKRLVKKRGILILSHRGGAFAQDLIRVAHQRGLGAFLLSSAPAPIHRARSEALEGQSDWYRETSHLDLTHEDILESLNLLYSEGVEILACISVWEGYRILMSRANEVLGAPDLTPEVLGGILDKHEMRNTLRALGLSRVGSVRVTPETLTQLQAGAKKRFIKPRRGLASFGAFSLKNDLRWEELVSLREEMKADIDYRGVFGNEPEFVAEDYIEGIELSFEMIVAQGKPSVIGVHEKTDLDETGKTTLESACVSPPVNVPPDAIVKGIEFLNQVARALQMSTGCFHIECRYHPATGRWEVIEVNPRVGGAYIYQSVLITSGGACLLDLWMETLLSRDSSSILSLMRLLESLSPCWNEEQPTKTASFFRVFFGSPGRTISRVEMRGGRDDLKPRLSQVNVRPGLTLPSSEREVFLGQALWEFEGRRVAHELESIIQSSKRAFHVEYA